MKKLIAILLTLILLFNLFGYKVWFYYLENRSQQHLQVSVDKQAYDEKDLVTIKVPLSLPYFTNWKEFEEYNGSIEVNGEHYNYVKRKVQNDTLILLCLPNQEQNMLSTARSNFENLLNTTQPASSSNKTSGAASILKALLGEYNSQNNFYEFSPVFTAATSIYPLLNHQSGYTSFITCPWQPPETI